VDQVVDCGLTGYDWIVENGNQDQIVEICELTYSRATGMPARWVLAVPEESKAQKPADLEGGIIATELVNTTRKYFASRGINVNVEFSWEPPRSSAHPRCHRRADRNRLQHPRPQPAHPRHPALQHHPLHRQQGRLGHPLETREDGKYRHAPARRHRGQGQGRAQDERPG